MIRMRSLPLFATALAVAVLLSSTHVVVAEPEPLAESYRLHAKNDLAGAIKLMRAAVAAAPGAYFPRVRLAYLSTQSGDWAGAAEAYAVAATLAPDAIEPLLGRQLALVTLGRWSQAAEVGARILQLDAASYFGRSRLAWTRYNQKDYRGAAELYAAVLTSYPADLDLRVGLGWSLLLLGRKADAATAFREVLGMQPEHAGATAGLAATRR